MPIWEKFKWNLSAVKYNIIKSSHLHILEKSFKILIFLKFNNLAQLYFKYILETAIFKESEYFFRKHFSIWQGHAWDSLNKIEL